MNTFQLVSNSTTKWLHTVHVGGALWDLRTFTAIMRRNTVGDRLLPGGIGCLLMRTPTNGGWFNTKVLSYQYRKSYCGDKTVVRSPSLHNGICYTGKMTFLYWIRTRGAKCNREFALSTGSDDQSSANWPCFDTMCGNYKGMTVIRPNYCFNGNSYIGKMVSLY